MNDQFTTMCFTGYRPKKLFGYKDRDGYRRLRDATLSVCEALYAAGVREFVSGGAQGFDQTAFWAVDELKRRHPDVINTIAIIEGQCERWPVKTLFGQQDFWEMVRHADRIHQLGYEENNARSAGQLLNMRNEHMLDLAQVVVGCWREGDSIYSAQGSGTANALKSAARRKLPCILVDPDTMRVYRDDIGCLDGTGGTDDGGEPVLEKVMDPIVEAPVVTIPLGKPAGDEGAGEPHAAACAPIAAMPPLGIVGGNAAGAYPAADDGFDGPIPDDFFDIEVTYDYEEEWSL